MELLQGWMPAVMKTVPAALHVREGCYGSVSARWQGQLGRERRQGGGKEGAGKEGGGKEDVRNSSASFRASRVLLKLDPVTMSFVQPTSSAR